MTQFKHVVHIRKEALKFSAAHMTVFPDGTKESLHGHNYSVEVSIQLRSISISQMISFSVFKNGIREICSLWDEKVLIAENCPYLTVTTQSDQEIEFQICKKRYVFPMDEVVLLSLDNITSESLAAEFCRQLLTQWRPAISSHLVSGIDVRIEESPGQGATCSWKQEEA